MKSYKVTGDRVVLGHEPGDVFEAEVPEAQERRLVERGHLEVTGEKQTTQVPPDKAADKPSGKE